MTAKGVPIDGKRSPIATPQEESLSLKEESHLPPRDSVLKRSPVADRRRTRVAVAGRLQSGAEKQQQQSSSGLDDRHTMQQLCTVIRSNLCRYFSGRTRGRGRLGDVAGGALELLAALLDVAHPHAHARRSTAPAAAPPRRGARTLATPARAITPLELDLIFDLFGPNFHTYGTLPPPP